ncbi:hypothetical protein B0H15DRAFT_391041 [Mycena belliarum]|uniref:Uncharacterized protein n=1 Tax=Mycena belliarum TaxID=1033014 RepID=A0AAD6TYY7_9AGAR|nr:hypothetical protein B0H15DRAFT_391041 [Mycena belliae]
MDSALPISLAGFALRAFLLAFNPQSHLRPVFIGIWEGVALYRILSTVEPATTAYVPCALRLISDVLFTETALTMSTILLTLLLSFVISDALDSHHSHDVRHSYGRRSRASGARATQVYTPLDSPRHLPLNARGSQDNSRADEIPRYASATRVSPVLEPNNLDRAEDVSTVPVGVVQSPPPEPEPVPVHAPSPNIITPPRTPLKSISPNSGPHDQDLHSDYGSQVDELLTPPPPGQAPIDTSHLDELLTPPPRGQAPIDTSHDELQTPLALELRELPPFGGSFAVEQGQPDEQVRPLLLQEMHSLDDSTSPAEGAHAAGTDSDNVSIISLQTGTQLSIISDDDAQAIAAKAEVLRNQAWEEMKEKRRLEGELAQAISQGRIKDTFLLRMEIDAAEERVRKTHARAARRHFRGE